MLSFICSYFNFGNSDIIKSNYIKFRKNFPHPITTVEVALPNQDFFIEDSIKIRANDLNIFWQKERCLNIAIENLPDKTESIAWVDTDIIFHNKDFMEDTMRQLEDYKVVQMFERVSERPVVNAFNNNISLGKKLVEDIDIKYPAIGFCWAFRKDVLVDNKLYDMDPVGNSDVLQLVTWMGMWDHKNIGDLEIPYRKEFLLWAWDSYEKVQGSIGFTKGSIEHMFHGNQSNRQYHKRNKILKANHYVPSKDLRIDLNNLYCLPYNVKLRHDIQKYFDDRTKRGS